MMAGEAATFDTKAGLWAFAPWPGKPPVRPCQRNLGKSASRAPPAPCGRSLKAIPEWPPGPARSNVKLYTEIDPLETAGFEKKVKCWKRMNAYARGKDSRVRQVSASLSGRMAAHRDHPRRRRTLFRHPSPRPPQRLVVWKRMAARKADQLRWRRPQRL